MIEQKAHITSARRKGIYREAINLLRKDWVVMANHLPGYNSPPEIEGYIPDIYAIKGQETVLIQIVSLDDFNPKLIDKLQQYAESFNHMTFLNLMVNAAGCRI